MRRRYIVFVVLAMLWASISPAQDEGDFRKVNNRVRVSFASLISFYKYPKEYVINAKRKAAFDISFLYEFCFTRFSSVQVGAEYVHQGMTFDSYYFAPGYSYLYNKKYEYHHTVSINEFHFPILFRLNDGREAKSVFSTYVCGGWVYRYFLPSYVIIDRPGGSPPPLVDKVSYLKNEYTIFSKRDGSILQVGGGLQRNNREKLKSAFLEVMFRWPISRFIYSETGKHSEMYIRDPNISIGVGFRW